MYYLRNAERRVSLLDPIADRGLLGPRYCTGGYISQVTTAAGTDLLSGPCRGKGTFSVFDGQGAPEVFATAPGADMSRPGDDVLVIGVGLVRRSSAVKPFHVRDNPLVVQFDEWDITASAERVVMKTVHRWRDYRIALTRTVSLEGRAIESRTKIENRGAREIPLRWFAHPFFPLTADGECCAFFPHAGLPENPGYYVNDRGFVTMRRWYPWEKGLFLNCHLAASVGMLSVRQRHPVLGEISAECGFPLSGLAIWANDRAFSFEAFYETVLGQGETREWGIRYGM
jgi:hypothetical protein